MEQLQREARVAELPHVGLKLAETYHGQLVPSIRRAFEGADLGLQAVQPRCQFACCIVALFPVQNMLCSHSAVEYRQVLFQLGNSLPDRAYLLGQRLCLAQCSP